MASEYDLDIAYMRVAMAHAKLSRGEKGKVGACLVTQHGVILGGCNGLAPGGSNVLEETTEDGIYRTKDEVIHAELSCILKAAREGVSVVNSTLYVTTSCCLPCSEMIAAAGIQKVVYSDVYRSKEGIDNLIQYGILTQQLLILEQVIKMEEWEECFSCGANFKVDFQEEDANLTFCPHCGEEMVKDLELVKEYNADGASLIYDTDDDEGF